MTRSLREAAGLEKPGTQLAKSDTVRQALLQNADKLKAALPKHLSADRMIQLACTTIRRTPALERCSVPSLAGAVMDAARLGLEIGVLGQGFLVPYKDEAQFIPGWQGLVDLVARAGKAEAWTGAVFEGDSFDYAYGDSPFIRHKPGGNDDPAQMTHVYACGRINGTKHPIIEVWTIEKVWRHRDRYNKVGDRHYSFKHPELYARKVVLLQVLKYLPKSPQLTAAVEMSNREDEGVRTTITADYVVETEPAAEPESPPQAERPPEPEGPSSLELFLSRVGEAQDEDALDLIRSEATERLESANAVRTVEQAIKGRIQALKDQS